MANLESSNETIQPLSGIRILAAEQMQSLPYATQLLSFLGADVVKVEHPTRGDLGRSSLPEANDLNGNPTGATFLRNNLNKRSVGIDLKHPDGQKLFRELAGKFDVVAENFKPGTMNRFNLGYEDLRVANPQLIYLSISGFGNTIETPYSNWPAFAPIAEAMSGIYNFNRREDEEIKVSPMGALGDTGSGLFAVIGVLSALRQRERTGEGSYIDISMFDSMVAFADIVPNYFSMGKDPRTPSLLINHGFKIRSGEIVIQVGREHQFTAFVETIGKSEWTTDSRFSSRSGWIENIESIREAVYEWADDRSVVDVCNELAFSGIADAPAYEAIDVVNDPHLKARHMLVEVPTDGSHKVLTAGNPILINNVDRKPATPPPSLGADTASILFEELSLTSAEYNKLKSEGVVT